jgi:hypothetical protein
MSLFNSCATMTTANGLAAEAGAQVATLQLNQHGKAPGGPSEAELIMDMCTAHWKQQGTVCFHVALSSAEQH